MRNLMRRSGVAVSILTIACGVLCSPQLRAAGFTGTWTGQIGGTKICHTDPPKTKSTGGSVIASLQESNDAVTGSLWIDVPQYGGKDCDELKSSPARLRFALADTLAGPTDTTLAFHLTVEGDPAEFTLTSVGSDLRASLTIAAESLAVEGTLKKAVAQATVAGEYSGTMSVHIACGAGIDYSSPVRLYLAQTDAAVEGAVVADQEAVVSENCSIAGRRQVAFGVTGVLSGTSFTGSIFTGGGGGPMAGSFVNEGLTLRLEDESQTRTISTVRSSSSVTDTHLTGRYSGRFDAVLVPCGRLSPVAHSGLLQGDLRQFGEAVYGNGVALNMKEDSEDQNHVCQVLDVPSQDGSIFAVVHGSEIEGFIAESPFTGLVTGNTITATVTEHDYPGEAFSFSLNLANGPTRRHAVRH